VIASGVVIDLFGIVDEIQKLKAGGLDITKNQLMIADNATVLLPYHKALDQAREKALSEGKIGTTGKGIGPAYEDRASRRALMMSDLFDSKDLKSKIELAIKEKNVLLKNLYDAPEIDSDKLITEIMSVVEVLRPYRISDVSLYLAQKVKQGKKILFEGAQGTLLDLYHGTYPYVTSSSTIAGASATSAGLGPWQMGKIVGVFKAYCTRVGSGPFPTELNDAIGTLIQKQGHEFGSTTGRARRCGWLDLVALKYSIRVNGINSLAMMKLDVLSACDEIKVCTGYKLNGEIINDFPTSTELVGQAEPIYHSFPGWKDDITGVKALKDLPRRVMDYITYVQQQVHCPIDVISVGPDREQTLWIKPLYKD
jgi:adenylosuccinate synthase